MEKTTETETTETETIETTESVETKSFLDTTSTEQEPSKEAKDSGDVDSIDEDSKAEYEPYDEFNLGEGIQMNQAMLDRFTPLMRESNLDQSVAQKFVDAYSEAMEFDKKEAIGTAEKMLEDQRHADYLEFKNSPEHGGSEAKFNEAVQELNRGINKFASPELKEVLKEVGIDNNPAVIKMFRQLGKIVSEDNVVSGGDRGVNSRPEDAVFDKTVNE